MRCYNPACGSPEAEEINISVNVTFTENTAETEYIGESENGDYSAGIGTICNACGETTYISDWEKEVVRWANHSTLILDPKDDPWNLCRTCYKVAVPDTSKPCLECEV